MIKFWRSKIMGCNICVYLAAFVITFIAPIQAILISVICLTLFDTITGIWAAYKRGEPITSHRMRQCLSKVLVYDTSLIIGHLLSTYLIPFVPIVKIIAALIGVIEGLSFFENLYYIYPNKIIKIIIDKLRRENEKIEKGEFMDLNKNL